jgi:hypothetical protein
MKSHFENANTLTVYVYKDILLECDAMQPGSMAEVSEMLAASMIRVGE